MPKKLHRNLKLYFSKLKKIRNLTLPNSPPTSSLLSKCKYPKTSSFAAASRRGRAAHGNRDDTAATLSDVDRFLHENFRSLYIHDDDDEEDQDDDDDSTAGHPPIQPSGRFFVSPGTSNLIIEDVAHRCTRGTSSSASSSNPEPAIPGDSVAVMTFSKDPYDDFRLSMQDMVESRHGGDPRQGLDWDFMEELLLCYLELNDRSVHKHILKAFTDLTVGFRHKIPPPPMTESQKVPTSVVTRRRRRRRRKVCGDRETSTEMAPQEKVKECCYHYQKHVEA